MAINENIEPGEEIEEEGTIYRLRGYCNGATAQRQANSANMIKDAIQATWTNKGSSRTAQKSIETVLAR